MVNPVKGVIQKIKEWGQLSAERGHRASSEGDETEKPAKLPPSKDTLAPHPEAPKNPQDK